jgi:3-oxoacyl-[acyl-carrier protein] reductase
MTRKPILFDGIGKVIVVVGAGAGIGKAITALCLDAGASVMAADLNPIEERQSLRAVACDISTEGSAVNLAQQTLDAFGKVNAVVNCVGIAGTGPITKATLKEWNHVMAVNLTSSLLLAQSFHAALKRTQGSFILFSSTAGRNGGTTGSGAVYAASKAGVINLARYLAKEWATEQIRVNTIAPGAVRTGPTESLSPERKNEYLANMLTHRLIEVEEIAAGAAFLLSDHARSITGTILNISGGLFLD